MIRVSTCNIIKIGERNARIEPDIVITMMHLSGVPDQWTGGNVSYFYRLIFAQRQLLLVTRDKTYQNNPKLQ